MAVLGHAWPNFRMDRANPKKAPAVNHGQTTKCSAWANEKGSSPRPVLRPSWIDLIDPQNPSSPIPNTHDSSHQKWILILIDSAYCFVLRLHPPASFSASPPPNRQKVPKRVKETHWKSLRDCCAAATLRTSAVDAHRGCGGHGGRGGHRGRFEATTVFP